MTTNLYLLTFIFKLCFNEDPVNSSSMHSPNIKYTKAELLHLKPKTYVTKMDTDICNQMENLKIK